MESYQPFNPLSFSISARSKYCAIHTLLLAAVNFTGSQGQKLGGPHARGAAAKRSYPTSEVRGSGQEELPSVGGRKEQPHVQGTVAAQAQEGLEELFHVQGQEGRQ